MGKFTYAVLMAFAMELSLYFFGGVNYSQTSLFSVLLNPSNLSSSSLWATIKLAVAALAAAQIIVGNFYQINIYALYALVIGVVLSFALAIVNFSSWMLAEVSGIVNSPEIANFVTAIFMAPLLLYFIIACLEWVRANQ